jgi:hypothetical protein
MEQLSDASPRRNASPGRFASPADGAMSGGRSHIDSTTPWATHMDGSDYINPATRSNGGRTTPHHQRARHHNPLEWLMQARQHEVVVHNSTKWKTPGEAYGHITRPTMSKMGNPHHEPQHRNQRSERGRPSSRGSSRSPGPGHRSKALPVDVTGVDRMRALSTESVYEDRAAHAQLQERRRRNALAVRAQMHSLSPWRRHESSITEAEKPKGFSESARWFTGPAAILGTPRNIKYDNGVPGPGQYDMPQTFGAPR